MNIDLNIKNWKTTLSAVVLTAAYVAKITNPEYAILCDAIFAAGVAGVGIFAKDSNVSGGTVIQ
jgi:hypothetical protein